jgi:hypothetical protein
MLRETEPGHSAACHRDDPASGYLPVDAAALQGATSQRRSGIEVAA